MMSQQEKIALKAAKEKAEKEEETAAAAAASITETEEKDAQEETQPLRPRTPLSQTGFPRRDEDGISPCSQACTSGTVTPTSTGVIRSDRQVSHAPPFGYDE